MHKRGVALSSWRDAANPQALTRGCKDVKEMNIHVGEAGGVRQPVAAIVTRKSDVRIVDTAAAM